MKIIPLGIDSNSPELGDYASEALDDIVHEAVVRKFRTDDGFILATIWRGAVHEVIYQTPQRFFWSRRERNRILFEIYGKGQGWSKPSGFDFGWRCERDDQQVRALYSKVMDYLTFVTAEFDSHRSDLRWKGVCE